MQEDAMITDAHLKDVDSGNRELLQHRLLQDGSHTEAKHSAVAVGINSDWN